MMDWCESRSDRSSWAVITVGIASSWQLIPGTSAPVIVPFGTLKQGKAAKANKDACSMRACERVSGVEGRCEISKLQPD
jgi:hypothetical protein